MSEDGGEGTGSISSKIKGLSEFTSPLDVGKMREDLGVDNKKGAFTGKSVAQLERSNLALKKEAIKMRDESRTDFLTGLGNRRALDELVDGLEAVRERLIISKEKLPGGSFICLDLTGLHATNETYGYTSGGDTYVSAVARSITNSIRASDRAFRIGGDEFMIHLPDISDREKVNEVLDRVDQNLQVEQEAARKNSRFKDIQFSLSSASVRYGIANSPEDAVFFATEEMKNAKQLKKQSEGTERGGSVGRIFI